ncbi:YitT family protein [Aquimarina agarivorans]|uniref:YitT family protein n=1 Tax=Aquimarina agarivorans TaxID=980584 RepID=UPI000248FC85|nr:YitT family protein [Aquimarina agarivorans]
MKFTITTNASDFKKIISEYVQIGLGILFASIGLKAFLLPNGFLDGGVTGIAILFNTIFGWNISMALIILSIPFLILAYFTISPYMVFKSIFSIVSLAIVIHFENFDVVTNDKLLISIFGGLLLGLGIGTAIKNGAVLDGSEILGIYLNRHLGLSIGKIILLFNCILFAITAITISMETAIYSILAFLITAKVTDLTVEGFENFIGVMIVSKYSTQIQTSIAKELGAGMTVFTNIDGFGKNGTKKEQELIQTVVNRIEVIKNLQNNYGFEGNAYSLNQFDHSISKQFLDYKIYKKGNNLLSIILFKGDYLNNDTFPKYSFKALNYDIEKGNFLNYENTFKPDAKTDLIALANTYSKAHLFHDECSAITNNHFEIFKNNFAISNDTIKFYFDECMICPDHDGKCAVEIPAKDSTLTY